MAEYHVTRFDYSQIGTVAGFPVSRSSIVRKRLDAARRAAENLAYDLADGFGVRDTQGAWERRAKALAWDGVASLKLDLPNCGFILCERVH